MNRQDLQNLLQKYLYDKEFINKPAIVTFPATVGFSRKLASTAWKMDASSQLGKIADMSRRLFVKQALRLRSVGQTCGQLSPT